MAIKKISDILTTSYLTDLNKHIIPDSRFHHVPYIIASNREDIEQVVVLYFGERELFPKYRAESEGDAWEKIMRLWGAVEGLFIARTDLVREYELLENLEREYEDLEPSYTETTTYGEETTTFTQGERDTTTTTAPRTTTTTDSETAFDSTTQKETAKSVTGTLQTIDSGHSDEVEDTTVKDMHAVTKERQDINYYDFITKELELARHRTLEHIANEIANIIAYNMWL